VDEVGGDVAELAVLVLRGPHEHLERLVGGAATSGHHHALGLLDDRAASRAAVSNAARHDAAVKEVYQDRLRR
jgi:hypothetical protein